MGKSITDPPSARSSAASAFALPGFGGQAAFNAAYDWDEYVAESTSYTLNGLNQVAAAGAMNFTYDGRGNLTSDGTKTYTYDSANRLTAVSGGGALAYDPLGRLYQASDGVTATKFFTDGADVIAEYDAAGTTVLRRYVHGAGLDEPLVWYEGSGTTDRRWLAADERGSIVAVTDGTGAATAINTYDAFGAPDANNQGRFQYTGQMWLPEVGLYHYKNRTYSPGLGRFLQADPIGYLGGMNLYAYAGNDPVNNIDPSGLEKVTCTGSRIPRTSCGEIPNLYCMGNCTSFYGAGNSLFSTGRGDAAEIGEAGAAVGEAAAAANWVNIIHPASALGWVNDLNTAWGSFALSAEGLAVLAGGDNIAAIAPGGAGREVIGRELTTSLIAIDRVIGPNIRGHKKMPMGVYRGTFAEQSLRLKDGEIVDITPGGLERLYFNVYNSLKGEPFTRGNVSSYFTDGVIINLFSTGIIKRLKDKGT